MSLLYSLEKRAWTYRHRGLFSSRRERASSSAKTFSYVMTLLLLDTLTFLKKKTLVNQNFYYFLTLFGCAAARPPTNIDNTVTPFAMHHAKAAEN